MREDLMEVIEYAKERYITIIPEIDIPGHTMALNYDGPSMTIHIITSPLF